MQVCRAAGNYSHLVIAAATSGEKHHHGEPHAPTSTRSELPNFRNFSINFPIAGDRVCKYFRAYFDLNSIKQFASAKKNQ